MTSHKLSMLIPLIGSSKTETSEKWKRVNLRPKWIRREESLEEGVFLLKTGQKVTTHIDGKGEPGDNKEVIQSVALFPSVRTPSIKREALPSSFLSLDTTFSSSSTHIPPFFYLKHTNFRPKLKNELPGSARAGNMIAMSQVISPGVFSRQNDD